LSSGGGEIDILGRRSRQKFPPAGREGRNAGEYRAAE
jgi:hypothetical protein